MLYLADKGFIEIFRKTNNQPIESAKIKSIGIDLFEDILANTKVHEAQMQDLHVEENEERLRSYS